MSNSIQRLFQLLLITVRFEFNICLSLSQLLLELLDSSLVKGFYLLYPAFIVLLNILDLVISFALYLFEGLELLLVHFQSELLISNFCFIIVENMLVVIGGGVFGLEFEDELIDLFLFLLDYLMRLLERGLGSEELFGELVDLFSSFGTDQEILFLNLLELGNYS